MLAFRKVQSRKMRVTEMQMLRWMSGYTYTLRDKIRYKDIRQGFEVANIKEEEEMKDKSLKMVWTCVKTRY